MAGFGLLAGLAQDLERCCERFYLIHAVKANGFDAYIKNLTDKRIEIIKAVGQQAKAQFDNLSEEHKQEFANKKPMQKKLSKLLSSIKKTNTELTEERIKYKFLKKQYAQLFIDNALHSLPEEQEISLEIPAFFEKVSIFQEGNHVYSHLFRDKNRPHYQNIQDCLSLTTPHCLDQQGGVIKIDVFSGVYQRSDLRNYFHSLQNVRAKLNMKKPLALLLANAEHVVVIVVNPNQKIQWAFIDANKLHLLKETLTTYTSVKQIRNYVWDGLLEYKDESESNDFDFSDENILITTELYGTKLNEAELREFVKQWKQDNAWKDAHEITFSKLQWDNSLGENWLHVAAENNELELVKRLVNHYAAIDSEDHFGQTPLYLAARRGHFKIVECLLEHKANLFTVTDKKHWTPLHIAIKSKNILTVQLLLAFDADVNAQTRFGVTPMMLAVRYGRIDIVELLLVYDADVNIRNLRGETILSIAMKNGHEKIIKKLLSRNTAAYHVIETINFALAKNQFTSKETKAWTDLKIALIDAENNDKTIEEILTNWKDGLNDINQLDKNFIVLEMTILQFGYLHPLCKINLNADITQENIRKRRKGESWDDAVNGDENNVCKRRRVTMDDVKVANYNANTIATLPTVKLHQFSFLTNKIVPTIQPLSQQSQLKI